MTIDNRAAEIDDAVVAININQTYRPDLNSTDLYDVTRGIWRLNRVRADKAAFALAVYQGVIKEVYSINKWLTAGSTKYANRTFNGRAIEHRFEFIGEIADDETREKYLGKSMPLRHGQNPIRYFNC